jgi:hypothetical protein
MTTYVILVSHPRYTKALNMAIESLNNVKWPKSSTIIIYNDCPDMTCGDFPRRVLDSELTRQGFIEFKTFSNIYEYSGFFIPLAMGAQNDDAFLLLHDTCLAFGNFTSLVEKAANEWRSKNLDILWASPSGQCNLCIFGNNASRKGWDMWSKWTVLDKLDAIHMEWMKNDPRIKNCCIKYNKDLKQEYSRVNQLNIGVEKIYAENARHKLVFPFIDVYKFFFHITKSSEHPQTP